SSPVFRLHMRHGSNKSPTGLPGGQVNMIVRRLPRLRDETVTAEKIFGGTLHINQIWGQLDAAYAQAIGGAVPDPLPCEICCHSLTDPSILSPPLRVSGAHTLTVFSLHTPHSLAKSTDPDALRHQLTEAVLNSLNSVLAEPIQDVVMCDADGRDCLEAK